MLRKNTLRSCLFLLPLIIPSLLLAQMDHVQKVEGTDADWNEGSVLLANGTELKGLLRYNDRTGVLGYESGSVSKSILPRNLTGFEFFDAIQNRQRVFYSLLYEDGHGVEAKVIFEVLRQYKDFAVIAKTDPVDVKVKDQSTTSGTTTSYLTQTSRNVTIYQTHTVYFLGAEEKIQPYLQIKHKEVDRSLFDSNTTHNKILDKKILEHYLGSRYDEMRKYAKDNKLELDEEGDLIKVLDEFDATRN